MTTNIPWPLALVLALAVPCGTLGPPAGKKPDDAAEIKRLHKALNRTATELRKCQRKLKNCRGTAASLNSEIDRLHEHEIGPLQERIRLLEKRQSGSGLEALREIIEPRRVWEGTIRRREDTEAGVALTLTNKVGDAHVVIVATLRRGQDLDGLVVGKAVAVRGTVGRICYAPGVWLSKYDVDAQIGDCTIEKK